MEDVLRTYADQAERLRWSAMLLDDDWRLAWVSTELRQFLGGASETDLGYGEHVAEALFRDAWTQTVHPDSRGEMFKDLAPFLLCDLAERGSAASEVLPDEFLTLLEGVEPVAPPPAWSTSFMYVNPLDETGDADYRVHVFAMRASGTGGEPVGWIVLFTMGVRPNLLALLARGDEGMYERMARLVEPGRRQAAILFCDLHGSGMLSRRLPTAQYFRLVRQLWMGIDEAVAEHCGIVGKHAGDGATAFFLVDDLDGPSGAAAAAIRTARAAHTLSQEVFAEVHDSGCLMKVGLHWGAGLYMGQLVPGGRLDVTALGDEVNEAARIQEAAGPHETLASKQLIEVLTPEDAKELEIDCDALVYTLVSELAGPDSKVARDAGTLAVTRV